MEKSVKFSKNLPTLKNGKKKVCKSADLSQALSPKLYDRVSKIMNLPFSKHDPFEERKILNFKELLEEVYPELLQKLGDELTEENFPDAIEQFRKSKNIDLNIEPRVPERQIFQQNVSWTADYVKKLKKERIIWQTKLFKDTKEINEKPLFEQTEELIDIAAEHFAVWLKQMDDESNINKEFVKQLFSIQVEGDASKALYVEPKEISVIPHEVSKAMNLPTLSIQNNLIKATNKDKKLRMRKTKIVAFGRGLPQSLRVEKFNENLYDEMYEINCPPDLQSLKPVFESILHLRSTRELIEYLKNHPELPRAKYLVDHKLFEKSSQKSEKTEKPLWSYFY